MDQCGTERKLLQTSLQELFLSYQHSRPPVFPTCDLKNPNLLTPPPDSASLIHMITLCLSHPVTVRQVVSSLKQR